LRIFTKDEIEDYKLCICKDILRGLAIPPDVKFWYLLGKTINPLGIVWFSSEGAL